MAGVSLPRPIISGYPLLPPKPDLIAFPFARRRACASWASYYRKFDAINILRRSDAPRKPVSATTDAGTAQMQESWWHVAQATRTTKAGRPRQDRRCAA